MQVASSGAATGPPQEKADRPKTHVHAWMCFVLLCVKAATERGEYLARGAPSRRALGGGGREGSAGSVLKVKGGVLGGGGESAVL